MKQDKNKIKVNLNEMAENIQHLNIIADNASNSNQY